VKPRKASVRPFRYYPRPIRRVDSAATQRPHLANDRKRSQPHPERHLWLRLHVAEAYVGAITAALERLQAQIYEPPKRTFACTDEEWEAAAPRPQTGRA
jgi:hypothetical protein